MKANKVFRINPPLTVERAREVLSYDPETGDLRWRIKAADKVSIGAIAANPSPKGHVRVGIDGQRYLAHRVAWLIYHGRWPNGLLDHRDRNPANNRIDNLREATQAQNLWNRGPKSRNPYGLKGVTFAKNRRLWTAQIMANGKAKNLGSFQTAEEAHAAYREAAIKYHGDFACFD